MTDTIYFNPNLVGVSNLLRSGAGTTTLYAICRDTRKLVKVDFTSTPFVVTSVVTLDNEPQGIADADGLIWITFKDGTLRSYTDATPPVQQSSQQFYAPLSDWVYSIDDGNLVFGSTPGTINVRNSVTNGFTRAENILPDIIGAFRANGRHFFFSSRGKGRVATISATTGAITLGNLFDCPHMTDHVGIQRRTSPPVLYTASMDRIVQFDIADPDAPTVLSVTKFPDNNMRRPSFLGGSPSKFYTSRYIPEDWYPFPYKQRGIGVRQATAPFIKGFYNALFTVGALGVTNPTIADDGTVVTL